MSSIWYAPQAPLCQIYIYTVLKAALKKADQSSMGVMIAIEYSYKLDRKNILIYGANSNQAGYCLDSHIYLVNIKYYITLAKS